MPYIRRALWTYAKDLAQSGENQGWLHLCSLFGLGGLRLGYLENTVSGCASEIITANLDSNSLATSSGGVRRLVAYSNANARWSNVSQAASNCSSAIVPKVTRSGWIESAI